jgi:signal transduction histidine kinase
MASTHLRTGWSTLVQALVDSEGQGVRARILLECVAREPWVLACGLWRRGKGPEAWTCILSCGAPELLHDRSFLEEVAAGRIPPDLVPGRGVLLSGQACGALALTYAGTPESESNLDLVSGLLHVARLVDAAEREEHPSAVEALVPALPRYPAHPKSRPREEPNAQPAALLAGIRDSEAALCARSRILFELELGQGVDACRIPMSPPEFVRAVRNLVSNAREALEHTQEGGRIRVSLRQRHDAQLILAVEDTGPGVPEDVLYALRARGPEELPGPGLGLAVSWGIALSVGGRLRVAESSGSGTRIELLLPSAYLS